MVHNTDFPPPTDSVRQMNTAISWFIWKGAIFKVPLSTLKLTKEAGGRALIHIMAKCMTLFILRMEKQGQKKSYFHNRLAHKMAPTRKNTQHPTDKDTSEVQLPISLQHRSGIHTHKR